MLSRFVVFVCIVREGGGEGELLQTDREEIRQRVVKMLYIYVYIYMLYIYLYI